MLENNLIRLPVVRNDRLVGMISRADVLDHMIEPSLVNVYGSY
jgi:CBS domain-containing protein